MPLNGDRCAHFSPTLRDLIWTKRRPPCPEQPERTEVLPAAQWMICRSGDTAFAAKGGNNNEPHNHNDIGSFVYCRSGEILLADLGVGEYTKEYFGAGRYHIFCNRSMGHSVPIVGGQEQRSGPTYGARDWACTGTEMTLDLSRAYDVPSLRNLRRVLRFDPSDGSVALSDCFVFDGAPLTVTERFITLLNPVVDETGVLLRAPGAGCCVAFLCARGAGPDSPSPQVERHIHRDHFGRGIPVYSVDYTFLPQNLECTIEFKIVGK